MLLKWNAESKLSTAKDKSLDYRIVTNILHKNNLPVIFNTVPLKESSYIKTKAGDSGELGLWQLMPGTASGFWNYPCPKG